MERTMMWVKGNQADTTEGSMPPSSPHLLQGHGLGQQCEANVRGAAQLLVLHRQLHGHHARLLDRILADAAQAHRGTREARVGRPLEVRRHRHAGLWGRGGEEGGIGMLV